MTFVTRRKRDTGDSDQDFLVTLGEDLPMMYAYKKGTADFVCVLLPMLCFPAPCSLSFFSG